MKGKGERVSDDMMLKHDENKSFSKEKKVMRFNMFQQTKKQYASAENNMFSDTGTMCFQRKKGIPKIKDTNETEKVI